MRRGFSMVEVVVGLGILAVCIGAMAEFSFRETRGVQVSLERYVANQVLSELQACMGRRSARFYRRHGFPERVEGFTALHASVIEDHPMIVPTEPGGEGATPGRGALAREFQALNMERYVLFEPRGNPQQGEWGVVTFLVRYRDRRWETRELFSFEIVY